MPSFDIVNKIDIQTLDNAINVARKDITNRYDFKGSKSTIELDKKLLCIDILTESEMRIEAIEDSEIFEFSTTHYDEDSYRVIKGD